MRGVYIIWALLPLSLFLLVLWALYKRVFKVPGREYPKDYLREAVYTTVLLFLAVAFEQTIYEDLISKVTGDADTIMIVGWLIYTFMLFVAAMGFDAFEKRREKTAKAASKKKPRPRTGKPANF